MYQKMIREELARQGYVGQYDPRHIEGYMRLGCGCLDGLSKAKFLMEVMIGKACIDVDGVDNAENLAKSYGL